MALYYSENRLQIEKCDLLALAAKYGSPCYIYSRSLLHQQWQAFNKALAPIPHLICYAVKANSNLAILASLGAWGAGFDIVSGGELARIIKAGGNPQKTVFSGVGKSTEEIKSALQASIGCFNVESYEELLRIQEEAKKLNTVAPIALRINPNINAHTHPYITTGLKETKFGINEQTALRVYQTAKACRHLRIQGIACHLGSQLSTLEPFLQAVDSLLLLSEQLSKKGITLTTLNLGGGLGISYQGETIPTPQTYCKAILSRLTQKQCRLKLIIEPGRALIAKAGILLTRIEYIKNNGDKNFAIVDAGMNDLLRPALYQAEQNIQPVVIRPKIADQQYDIVGPLCENSDFLAKNRTLKVQAGDYLAILDSGAYGFSMSSNYNSRPRVAEILVDKNKTYLIRSRETVDQLWENERFLPTDL